MQPNIASKQLDFLIDTVDVRDEDIIVDKLRLTQIPVLVFRVCLQRLECVLNGLFPEKKRLSVRNIPWKSGMSFMPILLTAFCEKPLFMSQLRDLLSNPVPKETEAARKEVDPNGKTIINL